jgi:prolyl-tRNA synthetase
VRIEIGPKDLESRCVKAVRRFDGDKSSLSLDGVEEAVRALLDSLHEDMLSRARKDRDDHVKLILEDWTQVLPALDGKNCVLIPWCETVECEKTIKERTTRRSSASALVDGIVDEAAPSMGAKSLCIPFEQPASAQGKKCLQCGQPAKSFTLFGRSY